jgi:serine/threonine-protein kinase
VADDDFKPSRAPGDRIGNYVIVRLLGRGGLSEVYLGRNVVAVKRVVAIKVLARRFQARPDLRKRLGREAEIYDALDHPNIVRMHDIGLLDDGAVYIVMDLIRGRTLREHMALGPLDLHGALHIMIQVTSAMCFAHRKDVIHRDLKPENIMVTPDADVKVLDFGIAKWSQGGEDSNEMPKLGTIGFLAPEQIAKKPVDGRADIYALGVIFYILLNKGRHPFENDDGDTSDAEMIARHLHAQPRPLHEFIDGCPPAASLIVSKCLAKEPDDRYATMDDLLDDLSGLIHESLPPNDPIAQRAMEEQEIKRVSGVQFIAGQGEEQGQRVTEPLVNYTPPAFVMPFDRQAQPPPAARGKGHTEPMPATTSRDAGAVPSDRTAVPPGVASALSAARFATVPTRGPAGSRVSPNAGNAPPPARPPMPPSPAAATPAASPRPAFAPARTDLTPSSSEADGPAERTKKRSEPMQPKPITAPSATAPASNRSIVLLGMAAGLIFAVFVASIPGFRAGVRAAPRRAEATAPTPDTTGPHVGAAPGEGAQEPAREVGATARADPAPPVDVPASAVPAPPPTPTGEAASPVAPQPSAEPSAATPPAAPTQTVAPASTTSALATPAAARSASPLPASKPKASPLPRTKTPATPAPPPTAAPAPFFTRPKPDPAPAAPPTHRIFGSEG